MKCAFVLGGAKQDVPGGIRYMATEATDKINQITLQMNIQHNTKTDNFTASQFKFDGGELNSSSE